MKNIPDEVVGEHLIKSIRNAIARVDRVLKQARPAPKGWFWRDTCLISMSYTNNTALFNNNTALFNIDCTVQVADMILAELLKDSSYHLLKGPYGDGSSRLCGVDLP